MRYGYLLLIAALCAIFSVDIGAAPQVATALGSHGSLVGDVLFYITTGGFVVYGVTALSTTNLTLIDWAKRMDPNGQVARIIELLAQTNEILQDMTFMEGNLVTGHQTSVRTGLPDVTWRLLNAGVLTSKSTTAQIEEHCGMLEAYSQVDRDLAELGGNPGAVRLSEARAFLEAMNQEMAQTIFYGTSLAPEEFVGLGARYNLTTAGNGSNIVNGGANSGSSDNTSIWLVAWDEETVTGIFPKGSQAGIFHEDLGLETVENAGGVTGALMRAYRDHWQWKAGIALKDWRYVVRIANIDTGDLDDSNAADLLYLMAEAEERIHSNLGRRAFYANRTIRRFLRHQAKSQVSAGGGLTFENVAGKRVLMFGDTPVRLTDALVNTEGLIS